MLPSIEIHGVRVLTFHEWAEETIVKAAPELAGIGGVHRPPDRPGHAIERLKSSFAWLNAVEQSPLAELAGIVELDLETARAAAADVGRPELPVGRPPPAPAGRKRPARAPGHR